MPRPSKKYHYLYKTTNKINGKFYAGMHSTNNLNDGYLGSGRHIKYAIKKYGKDSFIIEKLKFFDTREELIKQETEFVNKEFIGNSLCMNLQTGGAALSCSDEAREKISKGLIAAHLRKPMSNETKAKIGLKHKGKVLSAEVREKVANGVRGNTSHLGHHHSIEARIKMGLVHKGKPLSDEIKQKVSQTLKGHIVLDEIKDKISKANKGHVMSDEQKLKLSQANTGKVMTEEKRIARLIKMRAKRANYNTPFVSVSEAEVTQLK